MPNTGSRVTCLDCGGVLAEFGTAADGCPACGSLRPSVFALAAVATGVAAALDPGARVREPRASYHDGRMQKPARERRTGPSPSADGVVRFRRQEWDREGNWYEETVTDLDGSEVHRQAHPLRDHRGHCSAKLRSIPGGR